MALDGRERLTSWTNGIASPVHEKAQVPSPSFLGISRHPGAGSKEDDGKCTPVPIEFVVPPGVVGVGDDIKGELFGKAAADLF